MTQEQGTRVVPVDDLIRLYATIVDDYLRTRIHVILDQPKEEAVAPVAYLYKVLELGKGRLTEFAAIEYHKQVGEKIIRADPLYLRPPVAAPVPEQSGITHYADDATLARIAELERENILLKAELRALSNALDDPRTDLTMTAAEVVAELRKDAERYRWLRQVEAKTLILVSDPEQTTHLGTNLEGTQREADAAIDAAIAEEKENAERP